MGPWMSDAQRSRPESPLGPRPVACAPGADVSGAVGFRSSPHSRPEGRGGRGWRSPRLQPAARPAAAAPAPSDECIYSRAGDWTPMSGCAERAGAGLSVAWASRGEGRPEGRVLPHACARPGPCCAQMEARGAPTCRAPAAGTGRGARRQHTRARPGAPQGARPSLGGTSGSGRAVDDGLRAPRVDGPVQGAVSGVHGGGSVKVVRAGRRASPGRGGACRL